MSQKFLRLAFILALVGHISTEILRATIGVPAMISCLLPHQPESLNWFYWQESGITVYHWDRKHQTEEVNASYKDRIEVFSTEFKSGNISMGLLNVGVGDDKKTFSAAANFIDQERRPHTSYQWCSWTLQVSAPYGDLEMKFNKTEMQATCTTRGGYPLSRMSWKGLNKSNTAELDLKAEMSKEEDPKTKTYTMSSSVRVEGLQSVTCFIYDHHSKEEKNQTFNIPVAGESQDLTLLWIFLVLGPLGVFLIVVYFHCEKTRRKGRTQTGCGGNG
ncbi:CD276 antigen homolog [Antennarius striatus]|uniref:CD276 antigen homolog n=1 Tax=Antennarius striatus TaxID=241820 RepID=UPI0035B20B90